MSVLRRIAFLGALSVALFYAIHGMPGGAGAAYRALDPSLTTEEVERLLTLEGLDQPIHRRYGCWLLGRGASGCARWPARGVLRGDLGHSRVYHQPVTSVLRVRLVSTLALMLPALALAVVASIGLGLWAATREGRWSARVIGALTFVGQSTPLQWGALMAILVGSVYAGVFPPGGAHSIDRATLASRLHHAALPTVCLAAYHSAFWTRYLRLELLRVSSRPFVIAARAKGLTEGQVWRRHVLPNAMVPMLTSVALSLPSVFSGVLVVEQVFSYPGMGLLMYESVLEQDHLTAMVVFLAYAALAMVTTWLADALLFWLHPEATARGDA